MHINETYIYIYPQFVSDFDTNSPFVFTHLFSLSLSLSRRIYALFVEKFELPLKNQEEVLNAKKG